MKQKLTKKQQIVYDLIKQYVLENGYPPSVREISEGLGCNSSATAFGYIKRLEEKGYLRHNPAKPRAIELLDDDIHLEKVNVINIPYIKSFTPNTPLLSKQNIEEYIPMSAKYSKENEFMFEFHGYQMIDAGLYDGDMLIAEQTTDVSAGDIIIFQTNNEFFVRRLMKQEEGIIVVEEEAKERKRFKFEKFQIIGKINGIFRQM